jgi:hypothetical protein
MKEVDSCHKDSPRNGLATIFTVFVQDSAVSTQETGSQQGTQNMLSFIA